MRRKSMFSRRLWYVRRRNSARIHVILRLFAAMLVLILYSGLFAGVALPGLKQAVEARIERIYTAALQESADEVFSQGPEYVDILLFDSSPNGDISMISLDAALLRDMTEELLRLTNSKLGLPGGWRLKVSPAGPNMPVFSPGGILDLELTAYQEKSTVIDYRTEYSPINKGQTKLTVTMTARAEILYRGNLLEGSTTVTAVRPVGEYIIFGRLPENKKIPGSLSSSRFPDDSGQDGEAQ